MKSSVICRYVSHFWRYFLFAFLLVILSCVLLSSDDETRISFQINSPVYDNQFSIGVRIRIEEFKQLNNFDKNQSSLLPFVRMKALHRIAPKYKFSSCIVEKNMCTYIQALTCYLFDSEGFVGDHRTFSTETWEDKRFCFQRNEYDNTFARKKAMRSTQKALYVARDPYQRFLSAFLHLCVNGKRSCYKCGANILCVVERAYKELRKTAEENSDIQKMLPDCLNVSVEHQHFSPQTWYCDLWDEVNNYVFLKYGEDFYSNVQMKDQILEMLAYHNVEKEKLEYVENSFSSNLRSNHSTKFSKDRQKYEKILRGSKRHLSILNKIYFYDYVVFGFQRPL